MQIMKAWIRIFTMFIAWLIMFGHSAHAHEHRPAHHCCGSLSAIADDINFIDYLFHFDLGQEHLEQLRKFETGFVPFPDHSVSFLHKWQEDFGTRIFLDYSPQLPPKDSLLHLYRSNPMRGSPNFQQ